MFIIEIAFYVMATNEYWEIKIDMDENYKKILDLYNRRRFQLKYLLSIILLSLSYALLIIESFIRRKCNKKVK